MAPWTFPNIFEVKKGDQLFGTSDAVFAVDSMLHLFGFELFDPSQ